MQEEDVVVVSTDSEEDDETVWKRKTNNKQYKLLFEKFKPILFHHISPGYKPKNFPYKKCQELADDLKKALTLVNVKSTRAFIWKNLLRWIVSMKLCYEVDLTNDKNYNFILTDFMSQYVNYKCELYATVTDEANVNRIVDEIVVTLGLVFNGDIANILMTLLKIKVIDEYRLILDPLFRKYLSNKNLHEPNEMISYLRLILCYRQWKKLAHLKEDKELINEIAVGKSEKVLKSEPFDVDKPTIEPVLPKCVPPVNEENRSFAMITGLIGFASRNKAYGTRILLINKTLELEDTIEEYLRRYKEYILRNSPKMLDPCEPNTQPTLIEDLTRSPSPDKQLPDGHSESSCLNQDLDQENVKVIKNGNNNTRTCNSTSNKIEGTKAVSQHLSKNCDNSSISINNMFNNLNVSSHNETLSLSCKKKTHNKNSNVRLSFKENNVVRLNDTTDEDDNNDVVSAKGENDKEEPAKPNEALVYVLEKFKKHAVNAKNHNVRSTISRRNSTVVVPSSSDEDEPPVNTPASVPVPAKQPEGRNVKSINNEGGNEEDRNENVRNEEVRSLEVRNEEVRNVDARNVRPPTPRRKRLPSLSNVQKARCVPGIVSSTTFDADHVETPESTCDSEKPSQRYILANNYYSDISEDDNDESDAGGLNDSQPFLGRYSKVVEEATSSTNEVAGRVTPSENVIFSRYPHRTRRSVSSSPCPTRPSSPSGTLPSSTIRSGSRLEITAESNISGRTSSVVNEDQPTCSRYVTAAIERSKVTMLNISSASQELAQVTVPSKNPLQIDEGATPSSETETCLKHNLPTDPVPILTNSKAIIGNVTDEDDNTSDLCDFLKNMSGYLEDSQDEKTFETSKDKLPHDESHLEFLKAKELFAEISAKSLIETCSLASEGSVDLDIQLEDIDKTPITETTASTSESNLKEANSKTTQLPETSSLVENTIESLYIEKVESNVDKNSDKRTDNQLKQKATAYSIEQPEIRQHNLTKVEKTLPESHNNMSLHNREKISSESKSIEQRKSMVRESTDEKCNKLCVLKSTKDCNQNPSNDDESREDESSEDDIESPAYEPIQSPKTAEEVKKLLTNRTSQSKTDKKHFDINISDTKNQNVNLADHQYAALKTQGIDVATESGKTNENRKEIVIKKLEVDDENVKNISDGNRSVIFEDKNPATNFTHNINQPRLDLIENVLKPEVKQSDEKSDEQIKNFNIKVVINSDHDYVTPRSVERLKFLSIKTTNAYKEPTKKETLSNLEDLPSDTETLPNHNSSVPLSKNSSLTIENYVEKTTNQTFVDEKKIKVEEMFFQKDSFSQARCSAEQMLDKLIEGKLVHQQSNEKVIFSKVDQSIGSGSELVSQGSQVDMQENSLTGKCLRNEEPKSTECLSEENKKSFSEEQGLHENQFRKNTDHSVVVEDILPEKRTSDNGDTSKEQLPSLEQISVKNTTDVISELPSQDHLQIKKQSQDLVSGNKSEQVLPVSQNIEEQCNSVALEVAFPEQKTCDMEDTSQSQLMTLELISAADENGKLPSQSSLQIEKQTENLVDISDLFSQVNLNMKEQSSSVVVEGAFPEKPTYDMEEEPQNQLLSLEQISTKSTKDVNTESSSQDHFEKQSQDLVLFFKSNLPLQLNLNTKVQCKDITAESLSTKESVSEEKCSVVDENNTISINSIKNKTEEIIANHTNQPTSLFGQESHNVSLPVDISSSSVVADKICLSKKLSTFPASNIENELSTSTRSIMNRDDTTSKDTWPSEFCKRLRIRICKLKSEEDLSGGSSRNNNKVGDLTAVFKNQQESEKSDEITTLPKDSEAKDVSVNDEILIKDQTFVKDLFEISPLPAEKLDEEKNSVVLKLQEPRHEKNNDELIKAAAVLASQPVLITETQSDLLDKNILETPKQTEEVKKISVESNISKELEKDKEIVESKNKGPPTVKYNVQIIPSESDKTKINILEENAFRKPSIENETEHLKQSNTLQGKMADKIENIPEIKIIKEENKASDKDFKNLSNILVENANCEESPVTVENQPCEIAVGKTNNENNITESKSNLSCKIEKSEIESMNRNEQNGLVLQHKIVSLDVDKIIEDKKFEGIKENDSVNTKKDMPSRENDKTRESMEMQEKNDKSMEKVEECRRKRGKEIKKKAKECQEEDIGHLKEGKKKKEFQTQEEECKTKDKICEESKETESKKADLVCEEKKHQKKDKKIEKKDKESEKRDSKFKTKKKKLKRKDKQYQQHDKNSQEKVKEPKKTKDEKEEKAVRFQNKKESDENIKKDCKENDKEHNQTEPPNKLYKLESQKMIDAIIASKNKIGEHENDTTKAIEKIFSENITSVEKSVILASCEPSNEIPLLNTETKVLIENENETQKSNELIHFESKESNSELVEKSDIQINDTLKAGLHLEDIETTLSKNREQKEKNLKCVPKANTKNKQNSNIKDIPLEGAEESTIETSKQTNENFVEKKHTENRSCNEDEKLHFTKPQSIEKKSPTISKKFDDHSEIDQSEVKKHEQQNNDKCETITPINENESIENKINSKQLDEEFKSRETFQIFSDATNCSKVLKAGENLKSIILTSDDQSEAPLTEDTTEAKTQKRKELILLEKNISATPILKSTVQMSQNVKGINFSKYSEDVLEEFFGNHIKNPIIHKLSQAEIERSLNEDESSNLSLQAQPASEEGDPSLSFDSELGDSFHTEDQEVSDITSQEMDLAPHNAYNDDNGTPVMDEKDPKDIESPTIKIISLSALKVPEQPPLLPDSMLLPATPVAFVPHTQKSLFKSADPRLSDSPKHADNNISFSKINSVNPEVESTTALKVCPSFVRDEAKPVSISNQPRFLEPNPKSKAEGEGVKMRLKRRISRNNNEEINWNDPESEGNDCEDDPPRRKSECSVSEESNLAYREGPIKNTIAQQSYNVPLNLVIRSEQDFQKPGKIESEDQNLELWKKKLGISKAVCSNRSSGLLSPTYPNFVDKIQDIQFQSQSVSNVTQKIETYPANNAIPNGSYYDNEEFNAATILTMLKNGEKVPEVIPKESAKLKSTKTPQQARLTRSTSQMSQQLSFCNTTTTPTTRRSEASTRRRTKKCSESVWQQDQSTEIRRPLATSSERLFAINECTKNEILTKPPVNSLNVLTNPTSSSDSDDFQKLVIDFDRKKNTKSKSKGKPKTKKNSRKSPKISNPTAKQRKFRKTKSKLVVTEPTEEIDLDLSSISSQKLAEAYNICEEEPTEFKAEKESIMQQPLSTSPVGSKSKKTATFSIDALLGNPVNTTQSPHEGDPTKKLEDPKKTNQETWLTNFSLKKTTKTLDQVVKELSSRTVKRTDTKQPSSQTKTQNENFSDETENIKLVEDIKLEPIDEECPTKSAVSSSNKKIENTVAKPTDILKESGVFKSKKTTNISQTPNIKTEISFEVTEVPSLQTKNILEFTGEKTETTLQNPKAKAKRRSKTEGLSNLHKLEVQKVRDTTNKTSKGKQKTDNQLLVDKMTTKVSRYRNTLVNNSLVISEELKVKPKPNNPESASDNPEISQIQQVVNVPQIHNAEEGNTLQTSEITLSKKTAITQQLPTVPTVNPSLCFLSPAIEDSEDSLTSASSSNTHQLTKRIIVKKASGSTQKRFSIDSSSSTFSEEPQSATKESITFSTKSKKHGGTNSKQKRRVKTKKTKSKASKKDDNHDEEVPTISEETIKIVEQKSRETTSKKPKNTKDNYEVIETTVTERQKLSECKPLKVSIKRLHSTEDTQQLAKNKKQMESVIQRLEIERDFTEVNIVNPEKEKLVLHFRRISTDENNMKMALKKIPLSSKRNSKKSKNLHGCLSEELIYESKENSSTSLDVLENQKEDSTDTLSTNSVKTSLSTENCNKKIQKAPLAETKKISILNLASTDEEGNDADLSSKRITEDNGSVTVDSDAVIFGTEKRHKATKVVNKTADSVRKPLKVRKPMKQGVTVESVSEIAVTENEIENPALEHIDESALRQKISNKKGLIRKTKEKTGKDSQEQVSPEIEDRQVDSPNKILPVSLNEAIQKDAHELYQESSMKLFSTVSKTKDKIKRRASGYGETFENLSKQRKPNTMKPSCSVDQIKPSNEVPPILIEAIDQDSSKLSKESKELLTPDKALTKIERRISCYKETKVEESSTKEKSDAVGQVRLSIEVEKDEKLGYEDKRRASRFLETVEDFAKQAEEIPVKTSNDLAATNVDTQLDDSKTNHPPIPIDAFQENSSESSNETKNLLDTHTSKSKLKRRASRYVEIVEAEESTTKASIGLPAIKVEAKLDDPKTNPPQTAVEAIQEIPNVTKPEDEVKLDLPILTIFSQSSNRPQEFESVPADIFIDESALRQKISNKKGLIRKTKEKTVKDSQEQVSPEIEDRQVDSPNKILPVSLNEAIQKDAHELYQESSMKLFSTVSKTKDKIKRRASGYGETFENLSKQRKPNTMKPSCSVDQIKPSNEVPPILIEAIDQDSSKLSKESKELLTPDKALTKIERRISCYKEAKVEESSTKEKSDAVGQVRLSIEVEKDEKLGNEDKRRASRFLETDFAKQAEEIPVKTSNDLAATNVDTQLDDSKTNHPPIPIDAFQENSSESSNETKNLLDTHTSKSKLKRRASRYVEIVEAEESTTKASIGLPAIKVEAKLDDPKTNPPQTAVEAIQEIPNVTKPEDEVKLDLPILTIFSQSSNRPQEFESVPADIFAGNGDVNDSLVHNLYPPILKPTNFKTSQKENHLAVETRTNEVNEADESIEDIKKSPLQKENHLARTNEVEKPVEDLKKFPAGKSNSEGDSGSSASVLALSTPWILEVSYAIEDEGGTQTTIEDENKNEKTHVQFRDCLISGINEHEYDDEISALLTPSVPPESENQSQADDDFNFDNDLFSIGLVSIPTQENNCPSSSESGTMPIKSIDNKKDDEPIFKKPSPVNAAVVGNNYYAEPVEVTTAGFEILTNDDDDYFTSNFGKSIEKISGSSSGSVVNLVEESSLPSLVSSDEPQSNNEEPLPVLAKSDEKNTSAKPTENANNSEKESELTKTQNFLLSNFDKEKEQTSISKSLTEKLNTDSKENAPIASLIFDSKLKNKTLPCDKDARQVSVETKSPRRIKPVTPPQKTEEENISPTSKLKSYPERFWSKRASTESRAGPKAAKGTASPKTTTISLEQADSPVETDIKLQSKKLFSSKFEADVKKTQSNELSDISKVAENKLADEPLPKKPRINPANCEKKSNFSTDDLFNRLKQETPLNTCIPEPTIETDDNSSQDSNTGLLTIAIAPKNNESNEECIEKLPFSKSFSIVQPSNESFPKLLNTSQHTDDNPKTTIVVESNTNADKSPSSKMTSKCSRSVFDEKRVGKSTSKPKTSETSAEDFNINKSRNELSVEQHKPILKAESKSTRLSFSDSVTNMPQLDPFNLKPQATSPSEKPIKSILKSSSQVTDYTAQNSRAFNLTETPKPISTSKSKYRSPSPKQRKPSKRSLASAVDESISTSSETSKKMKPRQSPTRSNKSSKPSPHEQTSSKPSYTTKPTPPKPTVNQPIQSPRVSKHTQQSHKPTSDSKPHSSHIRTPTPRDSSAQSSIPSNTQKIASITAEVESLANDLRNLPKIDPTFPDHRHRKKLTEEHDRLSKKLEELKKKQNEPFRSKSHSERHAFDNGFDQLRSRESKHKQTPDSGKYNQVPGSMPKCFSERFDSEYNNQHGSHRSSREHNASQHADSLKRKHCDYKSAKTNRSSEHKNVEAESSRHKHKKQSYVNKFGELDNMTFDFPDSRFQVSKSKSFLPSWDPKHASNEEIIASFKS